MCKVITVFPRHKKVEPGVVLPIILVIVLTKAAPAFFIEWRGEYFLNPLTAE